MHVHVAIDSDEQGVAVIDRIAPWLPVLVAIAANSPFHEGEDTGYASWRSESWGAWPSAGGTEQFGSLAGYREACRFLMESGAALDEGMLYFPARLSPDNPTVEVRVADVCTDPRTRCWSRRWSAGSWRRPWGTATLAMSPSSGAPKRSAPASGGPRGTACPKRSSTRCAASGRRRARYSTRWPTTSATLVRGGRRRPGGEGLERVSAHSGASRQRAAYERTGDVRASSTISLSEPVPPGTA